MMCVRRSGPCLECLRVLSPLLRLREKRVMLGCAQRHWPAQGFTLKALKPLGV